LELEFLYFDAIIIVYIRILRKILSRKCMVFITSVETESMEFVMTQKIATLDIKQ